MAGHFAAVELRGLHKLPRRLAFIGLMLLLMLEVVASSPALAQPTTQPTTGVQSPFGYADKRFLRWQAPAQQPTPSTSGENHV